MAHFAEIDENNVVLRVVVIANSDICDEHGAEREDIGITFCRSLFGESTRWVQTSYNGNMRVRYAGIGYTYDPVRQAFVLPKPYPSWVFNETTVDWDPPVPYPSDGQDYFWDETAGAWIVPPSE